jgi:hypothetical protein
VGNNPYQSLPSEAFWRPSIANKSIFSIGGLYSKKFSISPAHRIVTAGSCFAQHIARKLAESGFNYCNYEPAPPILPLECHRNYNYGVYSARYGNIYTARQLLQLIERAYGRFKPKDDRWRTEHGIVDALRPAIEPDAFRSEHELEAARASHLRCVRKVFEESDLFVFTLGLTESWRSRADGTVYPLCPGTIAGEFSEDAYEFVNFTFNEIHEDMIAFFSKLREVNDTVRVLLTVSPVPLTATCSGQHVLAATTYSKSVLRAVAGQLYTELDFVDYFPSYEIISGIPSRSMFYEPNLRDVNRHGVDFVMEHFFSQHQPQRQTSDNNGSAVASSARSEVDVVCEEMMVDSHA